MKNRQIINIIIYSLLLFPFVSAYFPRIRITSDILLTGPRFFLLLYFFLFISFAMKNKFHLKIPKYIKWFIIYLIFSLLNRFFHQTGMFSGTYKLNYLFDIYILPLCFMILIENLNYNERDLKRFINVLKVVVIGMFTASFIQLFINPFFYAGNAPNIMAKDGWLDLFQVTESIYRCRSIFVGMSSHAGGISIGVLFIIFIFLNNLKYKKAYLILAIFLIFSGIAHLTRYVWLSIIIGIIFFLYYKYKRKWVIVFSVVGIISFLFINIFINQYKNTEIYQGRIVKKTYMSRINDPIIYFTLFFPKKPFFGFGTSSSENLKFTKYHNIIHNVWIETLFKDGIIGLFIIFMYVYYIYKRGRMIYETTGNAVFIVFIVSYLLVNLTAPFFLIAYYGYYVIFLYLAMNYKLYVENKNISKPYKKNRLYLESE